MEKIYTREGVGRDEIRRKKRDTDSGSENQA